MALNINQFKTKSLIQPMDPGTFVATCCAVIDAGTQITSFEGKDKKVDQVLLTFEFSTEKIEFEGEMRPRQQTITYTASVHEKAKLRKDLKNWRGRDFTAAELKDFSIDKVLGVPALVTISQVERNGTVYANITGITKVLKGMTVEPPSKQLRFDLDDENTWPNFAELPRWIQEKINNSLTLQERGIFLDTNGNPVGNNIPMATSNEDVLVDDDGEPLPF